MLAFVALSSTADAVDFLNVVSGVISVYKGGSKIYNWLNGHIHYNPLNDRYSLHSQSNGGGRYSVKLWNQDKGHTVTYFLADKDMYTSVIMTTNNGMTLANLEMR
ncbi:unnamed protein product [Cunninghamella echinulata]